MTTHSPQPRWSREQIRAARLAPLLPLLQKRGLQLLEQGGGNFILPAFPGLICYDASVELEPNRRSVRCHRGQNPPAYYKV